MTFNAQSKAKIINQATHIPTGEYITKRQAAELLGIDVTTMQYHIKQDNLPTIFIGNLHLINLKDIENFNLLPQGRPKKPLVIDTNKPYCRCGHLVEDHADKNGHSHPGNTTTGFCGCVFSKAEAALHR